MYLMYLETIYLVPDQYPWQVILISYKGTEIEKPVLQD